jgi:TatD DNase family protein
VTLAPALVLVDSHCHLNYLDAPDVRLSEARALGVGAFLCIGVDQPGMAGVLALAEAHDDVWATAGQHPEAGGADPSWVAGFFDHPRVVAVGEMGLDYFHEPDQDARRGQQQAFDTQLSLAGTADLPVVVHTRAAEADTLNLLRAHRNVRGVLHCFTESWDLAAAALDLGYCVSISGIVTFRNADNVRDVARRLPEDRLLIETDSPWLAPVPHRGRRNEPAFLPDTAAFVAELRGVSTRALAESATANFRRLFGIPAA